MPSYTQSIGEGVAIVPPNHAIEGSAEQRRCSVPSSLRSSAPPHCRRYAALDDTWHSSRDGRYRPKESDQSSRPPSGHRTINSLTL